MDRDPGLNIEVTDGGSGRLGAGDSTAAGRAMNRQRAQGVSRASRSRVDPEERNESRFEQQKAATLAQGRRGHGEARRTSTFGAGSREVVDVTTTI